MSRLKQPAVIVGVSGSVASAAALRWAVDEAERRRARLWVIRSWDPGFWATDASAAGQLTAGQRRAAAGAELAALIRATSGSPVPEGVVAELVPGNAERVLVDRSAEADLLVLGSAASAASRGRSIGPVIRMCLRRAYCPVAVVSPPEQETASNSPARERTQRRYTRNGEEVPVPVR